MQQTNNASWHMTRLLMVLCWFMWILTFFITVTLFQAALQIRVVAQVVQNIEKGFIQFNTDLVQISPLMTVKHDRLDEMLVRYYVETRYSNVPDREEMERRLGKQGTLAYLSSPDVYKDFKAKDDLIESAETSLARSVDILAVKKEKGQSYYTVDFDVYIYDRLSGWSKESKRVVVRFMHVPSRRMLNQTLANPYGFVVTRLDESSRRSGRQ